MTRPVLNQLNLISPDIDRSLAFYRLLGLEFPPPVRSAAGVAFHANHSTQEGLTVEMDTPEFARVWNAGWKGAADLEGRVVLGFSVEGRAEVDQLYDELTAAGHPGLQPPHDAFWGARYAILADPAGVAVGIMSPIDPGRRSAPPL